MTAITKRELLTSIRALANAIDATREPDRIYKHLRDLSNIAKNTASMDILDNQLWLDN